GPKRPQDRIPLADAKAQWRTDIRGYVAGEEQQLGPADLASAESFPASDPPAVDEDSNRDQPRSGGPHENDRPDRRGQATLAAGEEPHLGPAAPASAESSPASDPPAVDEDSNSDQPRSGEPHENDRPHRRVPVTLADGTSFELDHGAVVIAAITSCTNTSNPSVMVGAALLAKKAVERGLSRKLWVKTTLAPGSKVVMDYYERAGLVPYLDKLGFNLVGYGCTTCIGNSGPLPEEISAAVQEHDLALAAVLSGNRNFE